MKKNIVIHWFRQDLRLFDNPALLAASDNDLVMPIYILDDLNEFQYVKGAASRWWLHHSLQALNRTLDYALSIYKGDPFEIFTGLLERNSVKTVYWNRCYEPWSIKRDTKIKRTLIEWGVEVKSYNSSLLWEPWAIKREDGNPYKVFSAFYKKGCLMANPPRRPMLKPKSIKWHHDVNNSLNIHELELLPKIRWDQKLEHHWNIGEKGAQTCFKKFIEKGLNSYKDGRNIPSKSHVSRLSPYLHFGEISPNQIWHTVRSISEDKHVEHFCSELGWREFSYSLLYHNPDLPRKNLQSKFDHFPWVDNKSALLAWQYGNTGIPMVDAGMRELWQTGYMHNRLRMIVGSFLVKNLRIHWHFGARWFWDTLVDADLANNSAGWQWIAGCGADATPYFRIFNPVIQGCKYDPEGNYVRSFVPELRALPNKYLFSPWEASESILKKAGVILDENYPKPIINLKVSRNLALEAFRSLSKNI